VSEPIKVVDRDLAVARLRGAAHRLEAALGRDGDEVWVREQLAALWPDFVNVRPEELTKARMVATTRNRSPVGVTRTGVLAAGAAAATVLKQPRSFGDHFPGR
jgi:hypothetical protein